MHLCRETCALSTPKVGFPNICLRLGSSEREKERELERVRERRRKRKRERKVAKEGEEEGGG